MQSKYNMDDLSDWKTNNNNSIKMSANPNRISGSLDSLNCRHTSLTSSLNGDDPGSDDALDTDSDVDLGEYRRKTCVVRLDGRQYTIGNGLGSNIGAIWEQYGSNMAC